MKTEERGGKRHSIMDGVPRRLPALMQAREVQKRASRVGFDWEKMKDVLAKVQEELGELRAALAQRRKTPKSRELGDLLFAVVNLARFTGIDPEEALRAAISKFIKRFKAVEEGLRARGRKLGDASLEEMDRLWEEAKKATHP